MRPVGSAFEFGMELDPDAERVLPGFDSFHQLSVGRNTGYDQPGIYKIITE